VLAFQILEQLTVLLHARVDLSLAITWGQSFLTQVTEFVLGLGWVPLIMVVFIAHERGIFGLIWRKIVVTKPG
jgi:hypothetical protein